MENNYLTVDGHAEETAIRTGLKNMIWHGRMEQIDEHVYVDGAHNVEAIEAFCDTLEVLFSDSNKVLLFAVSKDKDYRNMIKCLGRISFDEIIIVRYSNERSAELDAVEETFRQFSGSKITTFDDIKEGYEYGKAHIENKVLFCVGSLYLVGDLLNIGV
jgi:dihydrofolate synthase/folylpolyglutamate synthase